MNGRYDSENDIRDRHDAEEHDREISLGTSTILGIFFILALICAVFFGFGYSMGRRSAQTAAVGSSEAAPTYDGSSSKPAPGSPAGRTGTPSHSGADAADQDSGASPVSENASASKAEARSSISKSNPSRQSIDSTVIKPVTLPRGASSGAGSPTPVAASGAGSTYVQVAAVSHQEDADVLMSALRKRGYNVAVRQVPPDKLLHVQIGPFAIRKDADAMRQRLLADGYNAIVK